MVTFSEHYFRRDGGSRHSCGRIGDRIGRCLCLLILLVTTGAAAQQNAAEGQAFDCVIEPKALIRIGSRAAGVLDEVVVNRGDMVRRGQVIARIESGLEKLEEEMARNRASDMVIVDSRQARLDYDEAKAKRTAELFRRKATSAQAYDEARTIAEVSRLAVREAEAELGTRALELKRAEELVRRRTIVSPVDGIVHERLLSPGEYAHEQSPVMVIAEIDPLDVEVFLPIDQFGKVKVGASAEVWPVEPIGGRYKAKVTVVDRVFDAASGMFGVRIELPNPQHKLPAGIRCRVAFPHP